MALPLVTLELLAGTLDYKELAAGLLREVMVADATMQLYQRAAWREALGGQEALEGLDREANLGLVQARFSFHLEPVRAPWWERTWGVLNLPLGRGWGVRAVRLLAGPAHGFRLCSAQVAGSMQVSITIGRGEGGQWKLQSQPAVQEEPRDIDHAG